MLHILWVIIRFILILLGIILGLLLLAVLLLLFCPVRYRGAVSLEEEDWKEAELIAGVSWLFHAVSVRVKKHGSETGISFRLLGIPLDKLIFRKRKKKNKEDITEKADKKEAPETSENFEICEAPHTETLPEVKGQAALPSDEERRQIPKKPASDEKDWKISKIPASDTRDRQIPKIPASDEKDRKTPEKTSSDEEGWQTPKKSVSEVNKKDREKRSGLFSRIQGKLKEIPVKLRNISLTFKRIRGKIGWYKELWEHPRTQAAFALVKQHAVFLLKHMLPTKIQGEVTFGFEDPAITGSILGILGMTIPFHKNCVEVTPVFDGGNLLRGNIRLKGRIYGVVLARAALVIYFNKNVKYVMKHWKHKEG